MIGYARALVREFTERGIPFATEAAVPIIYRGEPLGVPSRVDFACHGDILVEIKAPAQLGKRERKQLIHCLKASNFPRGLLLNSGAESLEIERAVGPTRLARLSLDSVPSQEARQPTQA